MQATYTMLRDLINPIMRETIGSYMNESFYNAWIASDTRRNVFFAQLVRYGLWPATRAPEFSQHGGEVSTNTWSRSRTPTAVARCIGRQRYDPRLGGAAVGMPYVGSIQFAATAMLRRVRARAARESAARHSSPSLRMPFSCHRAMPLDGRRQLGHPAP